MKRFSVKVITEAAKRTGGRISREYWADDPSCRILVVCIRDSNDDAVGYYHHTWGYISWGSGHIYPSRIKHRSEPFFAELTKMLTEE